MDSLALRCWPYKTISTTSLQERANKKLSSTEHHGVDHKVVHYLFYTAFLDETLFRVDFSKPCVHFLSQKKTLVSSEF